MVKDDGISISRELKVVAGESRKWQLQFIVGPRSEGNDELFLVRYKVGDSDFCQYRSREVWHSIYHPLDGDEWFFGNEPGEDWSLFDLSQSEEPLPGIEIGHLTEPAVEWFDHPQARGNITHSFFGAKEERLCVRRHAESYNFEIELDTQGVLWRRNSDGHWIIKEELTLLERFQRSVIVEHAQDLLQVSSIKLSRPNEGAALDLRVAAALALGSPFTVVPTFDSLLFELADQTTFTWEFLYPLLTFSARASWIFSKNNQEIAGIAVQSGSYIWLRQSGSWVPAEWEQVHGRLLTPFGVDNLAEAVEWWDSLENFLGEKSSPPQFQRPPVQFVTKDEPCGSDNFSILGLIRGPKDNGYGETRRAGVWIQGYWPVLDIENHLPIDEGDPRPWGGEYLYSVERNLEIFAIKFWDLYGSDCLEPDQPVTVHDFAKWTANQTWCS